MYEIYNIYIHNIYLIWYILNRFRFACVAVVYIVKYLSVSIEVYEVKHL